MAWLPNLLSTTKSVYNGTAKGIFVNNAPILSNILHAASCNQSFSAALSADGTVLV
jgi:hypothetical protein